jgi:hypothetical protein
LAATVVCFYPGYMWYDSIAQLRAARQGYYAGVIPPVPTLIWGLLDRAVPGALGMLLLDALLFWSGLGLLVYIGRSPRWLAPLLVLGVGFLPPIWAWLGSIVKDVAMGAALVLAYALLRFAEQHRSRAALLLAGISLFYGLAARHNAALAVLPLAWLTGTRTCQLFLPRCRSRLAVAGVGLAIFGTLVVANSALNRVLAGEDSHAIQLVMLHDLTAVSVARDTVIMPDFVLADRPDISPQWLREVYSPDFTPQIGETSSGMSKIKYHYIWQRGEFAQLAQIWVETIVAYPTEYIDHRARAFSGLLGAGRRFVCEPYFEGPIGSVSNELGFTENGARLYRFTLWALGELRQSALFRGWVYMLLAGGVLLTAWLGPRRQRGVGVTALAASGLLYALGYTVSAACDFRYLWWTVISVCLAPLALLVPEPPGGSARLPQVGTD